MQPLLRLLLLGLLLSLQSLWPFSSHLILPSPSRHRLGRTNAFLTRLTGIQSKCATEMVSTPLPNGNRQKELRQKKKTTNKIYNKKTKKKKLNKSSSNRVPVICCLLQHVACSACQWHLRKIDWGGTTKRVNCVNPWHPHEPSAAARQKSRIT